MRSRTRCSAVTFKKRPRKEMRGARRGTRLPDGGNRQGSHRQSALSAVLRREAPQCRPTARDLSYTFLDRDGRQPGAARRMHKPNGRQASSSPARRSRGFSTETDGEPRRQDGRQRRWNRVTEHIATIYRHY